MGYQELKKPKFYIDMMSYIHAVGRIEYFKNSSSEEYEQGMQEDLLYLNPTNILTKTISGGAGHFFRFATEQFENQYGTTDNGGNYLNTIEDCFPQFKMNYVALLNHNFGDLQWYAGVKTLETIEYQFGDNADGLAFDTDKSVNLRFIGGSNEPFQDYNGFSLGVLRDGYFDFNEIGRIFLYCSPDNTYASIGSRYLGSFMLGNTWSPPHNPQLKASILRKFDGIKSKKTQAGHTKSDMNYIGSPLWSGRNKFEQWEYSFDHLNSPPTLGTMIEEDSKTNLGNMGRRSWKLTWDSVSDTDLFAELEQSNNALDIVDSSIDNPFLESDSFISRVWTPTLGGSLPFMFQIDDSNNNPDQFVIARFKKHSLTLTSKAPNLYSFSVDIEETW